MYLRLLRKVAAPHFPGFGKGGIRGSEPQRSATITFKFSLPTLRKPRRVRHHIRVVHMAWVKPQYPKGRIDWAGGILIQDVPSWAEESLMAQEIVNNWRSAHSYPLHAIKMTLKSRARKIDAEAIVAQRLKRLESIKFKLRISREAGHHSQLSQMQDIGGCRAVLSSVTQAKELVEVFAEANRKAPHRGPQYSKTFDYIAKPKPNGYRNVHLVYKYRTESPEHVCYNGQRIEIQIRSALQHAWATAVETYSTFAGEALKSNIGSPDWIRFFALMGSALAMREDCPLVPNTPTDKAALTIELSELNRILQVEQVLAGWNTVQRIVGEHLVTDEKQARDLREADFYLLMLDPNAGSISIETFTKKQLTEANAKYAAIERDQPHLQAVLVSVDSLDALRFAYPNYYLDTSAFIDALRIAVT